MEHLNLAFQYIHHSGFSVETDENQFIFDYYQGDISLKDKNIYVFSSHIHSDHFNPRIFEWQKERPDIQYILSSDIEGDHNIPQNRDNITFISPYEEIRLHNLNIKAYNSTDEGVSFLVKCDGRHIFHAGDLNWWYWSGETQTEIEKAEKMFKDEIQRIRGEHIDIAFFPVDPRLEQYTSVGAEYFIQEIKPQILVPMHFWDDFTTSEKFAEKMKDAPTRIFEIAHKGQTFLL
jgi:L-ascorbate metabolism protein UlaG (beta-lactamase superfamily)